MITASMIRPLRVLSDDHEETGRLKTVLARFRQSKPPDYLSAEEFDQVLKWKLRGQYGRQKSWRAANTPEVIEIVTRTALSIEHADRSYETDLRLAILCSLRGVGVPVASAILALVYPDHYAVIDFRGWRQVFDEERTCFTIADYKRYLQKVSGLSLELGWPVQEVDLAIWQYDMVHPSSRR